jgi:TonB family protein
MLREANEEAQTLLARALTVSETRIGDDHPDLVILLNDLVRLCLKQSAYAFAEPLLLRLLAIKQSKGADHPEVATVLASLGAVRQSMGRHESAEQLWRRVLEIRERTLAPNHLAVATAIEHLAEACVARGKLAEALALYQRAQPIRTMTLGAEHPSLRVSRERVADLQLQASEFSLDPIAPSGMPREGIVAPPLPERLSLPLPAPTARETEPVTARWSAPLVVDRVEPVEPLVVSELTSPASGAAIKVRDPESAAAPYAEMILSMRNELEPGDERPSVRDRLMPVTTTAIAFVRKQHKAIEVGAVAVAVLFFVFTTGTRASAGSDSALSDSEAPAVQTRAGLREPMERNASVAGMATPTAKPVADAPAEERNARVETRRSPERKSNEKAAAKPPVAALPKAVNVNLDSVVSAVSGSRQLVADAIPTTSPSITPNTRDWSFTSDSDAPVLIARQPQLITPKHAPRYPVGLKNINGEVRVRFNVDTNGQPIMSSFTVLSSPHPLFSASVRNVILTMRFDPARSPAPESKPMVGQVETSFRFVSPPR